MHILIRDVFEYIYQGGVELATLWSGRERDARKSQSSFPIYTFNKERERERSAALFIASGPRREQAKDRRATLPAVAAVEACERNELNNVCDAFV